LLLLLSDYAQTPLYDIITTNQKKFLLSIISSSLSAFKQPARSSIICIDCPYLEGLPTI
jgi:hypothetical protein